MGKLKLPRLWSKSGSGSGSTTGGDDDTGSQASASTQLLETAPSSPPPSYEHVLAQSRLNSETSPEEDDDSSEAAAAANSRDFESPKIAPSSDSTVASNEVSNSNCSDTEQQNRGWEDDDLEEHDECDSSCESRVNDDTIDKGGRDGNQEDANPPGKVIVYQSSKELYRAIAAQWGITCKMSDHCRCYDCQSHYFDYECDRDNDHEKTDGGLGAGTPMFISEVMHGTACSIL